MYLEKVFVPYEVKEKTSQRLERELLSEKLHPKLRIMLDDLGYWLWSTHKVRLVVTGIFRTDLEQEDIYGIGTSKRSPHQDWRAVDVVPENRDNSLYKDMEKYIDSRYLYLGGRGYTSSDAHNVGRGQHLHIQVGWRETFSLKEFKEG